MHHGLFGVTTDTHLPVKGIPLVQRFQYIIGTPGVMLFAPVLAGSSLKTSAFHCAVTTVSHGYSCEQVMQRLAKSVRGFRPQSRQRIT